MLGKISLSNLLNVVLPLEEQPLIPITIAFLSLFSMLECFAAVKFMDVDKHLLHYRDSIVVVRPGPCGRNYQCVS